jgi:hypothetical protein
MLRRITAALPAMISGIAGATFFASLAGSGLLDPREVGWVFHGDWQWHFLGWHFFRNESWHLPPGALTTYMEPIGSAIGYTDSIPLLAFILKPFAALLPNPMQYLGLWLLICFVLQGVFGSVLIGAWTKDPVIRTLAGCLFVLVPTLLGRLAHPALCSHWVLLWALWLTMRDPPLEGARAWRHHGGVALASGLLHPYLAVMVLGILAALAARRVLVSGRVTMIESGGQFISAAIAVVAGWWASGLLIIASPQDLETDGLGKFSMNLLGLVNPGPRSRLMPELPWTSAEQHWEGFHYLGLGLLVLCGVALIRAVTRGLAIRLPSVPLLVVLTGLALYSLSPRITFGDRVLLDWLPYVGESSTFRASARFFWPVTYALVATTLGFLAASLSRRLVTALFIGAIALQAIELQPWYVSLYYGFRNPAFLGASLPQPSHEWDELLPHFERIRMYSPQFCRGPVPVPMPFVAYLAGLHGLGLNDGFAARMDDDKMAAECERLRTEFTAGVVDGKTVYLLAEPFLKDFQLQPGTVTCGAIDGVSVCVSRASAERLSLAW